MKLPKWLEELLNSVCAVCISEGKGRLSGFSCRWANRAERRHQEAFQRHGHAINDKVRLFVRIRPCRHSSVAS
jgi:hypothetical protein